MHSARFCGADVAVGKLNNQEQKSMEQTALSVTIKRIEEEESL